MASIEDMVETFRKHQDKFKSLINPLCNYFKFKQLYIYKLLNSGHIIYYTSQYLRLEDYWYSEKMYLNCPIYRRVDLLNTGVETINSNDNVHFENFVKIAESKFHLYNFTNIFNKTKDGVIVVGGGFDSNDLNHLIKLHRELPLMYLFVNKFFEEYQPIIRLLDDYRCDIASLIGPKFYKKNPENPAKKNEKKQRDCLLRQLEIEIPTLLTKRQEEISHLLLRGCNSSEIADSLTISQRTVEHHLERMRDKFCCSKKSELIQKLQELVSIRCLL